MMKVITELLDRVTEAREPDLSKHRPHCTCESCREYHREYAQYSIMAAAGLLDADMRPPVPRNRQIFDF